MSRSKTGHVLHRFQSDLPNGMFIVVVSVRLKHTHTNLVGSKYRVKGQDQHTVLDCIFYDATKTYYVVDILCWKVRCIYCKSNYVYGVVVDPTLSVLPHPAGHVALGVRRAGALWLGHTYPIPGKAIAALLLLCGADDKVWALCAPSDTNVVPSFWPCFFAGAARHTDCIPQ